MKRLLAIAFALFAVSTAQAQQKTTGQIKTDITNLFPSTGAGLITANQLRQVTNEIADSYANKGGDTFTGNLNLSPGLSYQINGTSVLGLSGSNPQLPASALLGTNPIVARAGSVISGHCASYDGSGNLTDSGASCAAGSQLSVTSVGMAADGRDNSTYLSALMTAISPNLNSGSYPVVFPAIPGTNYTNYRFSKSLSLTRSSPIICDTGNPWPANTINLVFDAGVDGVINEDSTTGADGGYSSSDIRGCGIISLGRAQGTGTVGSLNLTSVGMADPVGVTSQYFAAGDGIIGYPNFNPNVTFTGSITGATLTVTSISGSPIHVGDGIGGPGGLLAGQVVTAFGTGAGGTGTYTISMPQATTISSSSFYVQIQNTRPAFPVGAYLDSVSGTTLTLNTAFPIRSDAFLPSTTSGTVVMWRLPAAQVFPATTTSGSNSMGVGTGPRKLQPGDMIWSDAFPLGATVYSISGAVGSQTAIMYDAFLSSPVNATVTHAAGSGKMWIVPAGLKRRTQAQAHGNTISHFPIGMQLSASSAGGLNATTNLDEKNYMQFALVGRLVGGNNTGASTIVADEYARNSIADIVEGGTVGSVYLGANSNSAEGGTAPYGIIGNCSNQNYTLFSGMYVGFQNAPFCSTGILTAPTVAGAGPIMLSPQGGRAPVDMREISAGQMVGTFFVGDDGNGVCTQFSGRSYDYYIQRFAKNCGTSDSLGIAFNATVDAVDFIPNSLTSNPLMRFGGDNYTGTQTSTARNVQFPQGFLLNNTSGFDTDARLVDMSAIAPNAAWNKRGQVRFNLTPSKGGFAGWSVVTDGAGNAIPFGPIANNAAGTDYTIPILRSGSASNTDLTGRIALSGGAATYTLAGTYATAPNCLVQDVTTPANNAYVVESTTTLTFHGTGTDTLKWICAGLN